MTRVSWRKRALMVTACHEAGHAVAAILTDKPFSHVTVIADDEFHGHINHTDSAFFDEVLLLEPRIRVLSTLAGAPAQRYFFPRSHWRRAGSGDWKNAGDVLRAGLGLQGAELEAELVRLSHVAAELVAKHHVDIQKVAAALGEHKTLCEDQVRAIMGRAPRRKKSSLWYKLRQKPSLSEGAEWYERDQEAFEESQHEVYWDRDDQGENADDR